MQLLKGINLNLLAKFSIVSFLLIAVLGGVLAWGIESQLEASALKQAAESAADQVEGVVGPALTAADLAQAPSEARYVELDELIRRNIIHNHVVRVKIWNPDALLVYSDDKSIVGQNFPATAELNEALNGELAAEVSSLTEAENVSERGKFSRLLEIYIPMHIDGVSGVAGVYEIYHDMAVVQPRINEMRAFVWGSLGVGFMVLYSALFTLVRNASQSLRRRNEENARLYAEASKRLEERERAEAALSDSEARYQKLVETSPDAITLFSLDGTVILCNQRAAALYGFGHSADLIGRNAYGFVAPEHRPLVQEAARVISETGAVRNAEYVFVRKDGSTFPAEFNLAAISDSQGAATLLLGVTRDVTERRRAEEALRRQALTFENISDATVIQDLDFNILDWNPAAERLFGYTRDEALGHTTGKLLRLKEASRLEGDLLASIQTKGRWSGEISFVRKDGAAGLCEIVVVPLHDERGRMVGTLSASHDISERKKAQDEINRQLARLAALRNIDMAIISSVDLQITLGIILDNVIAQLQVDAADVLILKPDKVTMRFAAGRGFRTNVIDSSEVRIGEGHAGVAALQRRVMGVPDLHVDTAIPRHRLLLEDGFVGYYVVPLIAKGEVKGVLEVYSRTAMSPNREWLAFFDALAGQAAIAIDNDTLFSELQSSNVELALAYDVTLEGWSRALDLRDHETEGHTRRVTELTVRLARAMNVPESEMVHLRRGALLHDIGKMGIPDAVLLKPGPLTDDEWATMRKHPEYAYLLLSPIPFLRQALDIPYCHHEKWDGSGYPRKLAGEQIPLSARIFAVVDVWDALRSDRPYRAAWPEAKVRDHLQSLAGSHFDPKVVKAFLALENMPHPTKALSSFDLSESSDPGELLPALSK